MKPLQYLWLEGLLVGSLVVGWHPLVSTLRLALENDEYTHILLIIPISLTLISAEWRSLRQVVRPNAYFGSLALCVAAVMAGLSRWQANRITADLQLSINMLALVTWWIGTFVLCFGTRVSRTLLFPLCFLFWMVPIPAPALDELIKGLQRGSAFAARVLFLIANVPVTQRGVQLSIPGLTVEVAKECSSIRSSLMLLVTTMVLAQILLRSPWRKVLLVAFAVPLAVAKNGLRIFTIAMLGTRVDPSYLTGGLHHEGGIVFFGIALAAVFLLLWIFRRAEREASPSINLLPRAALDSRSLPHSL